MPLFLWSLVFILQLWDKDWGIDPRHMAWLHTSQVLCSWGIGEVSFFHALWKKHCSKFSRSKQGRSSAGNCLHCVVWHPGKSNWREQGQPLAHRQGSVPHGGAAQAAGAAAPRTFTVNKWSAVNACCCVALSSFLYFLQLGIPGHRVVLPTAKLGFPTLISVIRIPTPGSSHDRCAQRPGPLPR